MLLRLSLRNIKRSLKDYTIYFFTLVLGVAIFYLFNSIESQSVMMDVSSSTREIIKMMVNFLSGVSVLVSFILGFLIIYASRFLMKRRHKEFGIYMILGMGKRQISWILLCETFLIGLVSLGFGLLIGIALSQVMSIFVANMFEADMTRFEFIFSSSATFKTILYFGVIYVIVMIFNTFSIGRQQLIDLLLSKRKNEQIKAKNTWLCTLVFLLSIGMLGYAYYLVTVGVTQLDSADKIFIPIALGISGTYLLFWSLSGFILKIMMLYKKRYFKGLNSFVVRQFSSQMNTTVFSMSLICLMLFTTICVLSSGIALKNAVTSNMQEFTPVDIYLEKNWDLAGQNANGKQYTQGEIADSHISIAETFQQLDFSIDKYFKDVYTLNTYATNDLTLKDTLGKAFPSIKQKYTFLNTDMAENIMRISDYNQIAKRYGQKPFQLSDHQYMIVANFDNMVAIRNQALKVNSPIQLLNQTYTPKYQTCQEGFLVPSSNASNSGIILVLDQAVNESIRAQNIMIANYKANDKAGCQAIEDKIIALDQHPYSKNTNLDAITRISIYEGSVGIGAMVIFIGIYIGVVFLISSAALLALKELSESADNKERYTMLRKIGTDEKMIQKALFKQIALFFVAPLMVAIVHSVFGIQFCTYIISTFGKQNLLPSIIATVIFIILIYGGYMMVTYYSSRAMLKD